MGDSFEKRADPVTSIRIVLFPRLPVFGKDMHIMHAYTNAALATKLFICFMRGCKRRVIQRVMYLSPLYIYTLHMYMQA